ncbi:3-dehydroquinate synthase [Macrococcoides goetzii]|nr:3-dehydroquinate synthase family protein [Macrococcus goetzii]TDM45241.1 3-dehydroquinate synthase [Macrococcus goetzii]
MKLITNYQVDHKAKNYEIIVTENALEQEYDLSHYHKCFALIDTYVYFLHKAKIDAFMKRYDIEKVLIPSGEAVKTMHHFSTMTELLLEKNIKRNDCLIAIGGGATGDFTGYVAASLLRGISFIQVPTTILAHDAAIGGKTGINSKHGKNLIGAFKRPDRVIYDISFLNTLNDAELLSGFAEIVKHVLLNGNYKVNQISDIVNDDLSRLMQAFNKLDDLKDMNKMQTWITYGIQTKLNVVERDELESGVRKYLNFGHTLGHALEFSHKLPHGIAVIHGMMYALILSGYEENIIEKFYHWLIQLGYPEVEVKSFEYYYSLLSKDKKNETDSISFVVMEQRQGHLEDVFYLKSFEYGTLKKSFERWVTVLRSCYGEK